MAGWCTTTRMPRMVGQTGNPAGTFVWGEYDYDNGTAASRTGRDQLVRIDGGRGLPGARCQSGRGPEHRRSHRSTGEVRFQQAGRGRQRAWLEGVPAAIPRPDAARVGRY